MKRLGAFFGVFIIVLAVWQLQAVVFDYAVRFISYDHVPASLAFAHQTLNRGTFFASLFSAFCVFPGRCHAASVRMTSISILGLPFISGVVAIMTGVLFYILYSLDTLGASTWTLAFPRRHAVYFGMQLGFEIGSWLAISAGCMLLWRERFAERFPFRVSMIAVEK